MADLPINLLDAIVIFILLASGLFAFFRGLTREIMAVLAWLGAIVATLQGFPYVAVYAHQLIETSWLADISAAVGLFVASLIVLTLISHSLSQRVQQSAVGALDRTLGFVFGLLRGVVIVSLAYLLMIWLVVSDERPPWITQARSLPLLGISADLLLKLVPSRENSSNAVSLPNSAFFDSAFTNDASDTRKETVAPKKTIQKAPVTKKSTTSTADNDNSGNSAADNGQDSGYNFTERRTLERLFQATQQ
jgi:membrane protein required for colicin V production